MCERDSERGREREREREREEGWRWGGRETESASERKSEREREKERERGVRTRLSSLTPCTVLEVSQGQMDDLFSQLPCTCHLEEVPSVED